LVSNVHVSNDKIEEKKNDTNVFDALIESTDEMNTHQNKSTVAIEEPMQHQDVEVENSDPQSASIDIPHEADKIDSSASDSLNSSVDKSITILNSRSRKRMLENDDENTSDSTEDSILFKDALFAYYSKIKRKCFELETRVQTLENQLLRM
ncbi:unnamed protein product, partial [Adineta steineri]